MANLFGTGINQVPTNGMLGNLAFQDKAFVSVDKIGIGTTAVDTGTANQTLQNYGGAYITGNVGLGTTTPSSVLSVIGDTLITGVSTSARVIVNAAQNTADGGGQIYLNGTGNRIDFNTSGVTAPTFTTRSSGTKIVLYPGVSASAVDYGFGIETATLWYSIPQAVSGIQHRWYAGQTQLADLKGTGEFVIGFTGVTGTASQLLQVTGGGYFSSSVGIGRTNPSALLHLTGGAAIGAILERNTTGESYIRYQNSSGTIHAGISTGATFWGIGDSTNFTTAPYFVVRNTTGNVGIGTTNPVGQLQVASGPVIIGAATSTGTANQKLQVTGGAYISSNVGVGTTVPTYIFTVTDTGTAATSGLTNCLADFTTTANSYGQINLRNTSTGTNASGDVIITADNGSDTTNFIDLGINNSGFSVGSWTINGANDGYLYTSDGNLSIGAINASVAKYISFFTGGTLLSNERMRINAIGVGIGSTNPTSRLDVVGDGKFTGIVTATQFTTGSGNLGFTTNTINGPSEIIIDPLPVGVGTTSGIVRIRGDLYVDGTQFIVNSTTIELADFNVGIASTVGTNALLDGAGIGIGSANIRKTITWNNTAGALTSSEDWNLASGKQYEINGTSVLTSTTLGSGVVNSSLTSVGTLGQLQVTGVSTFTNGPVLIGTATSTGTASQRLQVTGGGYFSGSVGIGSTNPQSTLSVGGTITELYAGTYWNVVTQADVGYGSSQVPLNQYLGQLAFLDDFSPNGLRREGGGSDDVGISSIGYVGIGTTNPTQKLDVFTPAGANNVIVSRTNGTTNYSIFALQNTGASGREYHLGLGGSGIAGALGGGVYLWDNSAGATRWVTDSSGNFIIGATAATGTSSQRLQVTGGAYVSGSVGIGITNPSYTLDVNGTIRGERFRGINSLVLNTYTTVNPASNVFLYSQPNDRDSWIYLDSADTGSNWGIYHRQIDSTVSNLPANSIGFIGGGSNTLQSYISLGNGNAYFAGNLGVGAVSPSYKLDINGTVRIPNETAFYMNDSGGTARRTALLSNGNNFYFGDIDNAVANSNLILPANANILLLTNNSERVRITSTGNVGINTTNPGSVLDVRFATNPVTDNGAGNNVLRVYTISAIAADSGGAIGLGGQSAANSYSSFGQIAGRKDNSTSSDYAGYLQFVTNTTGGTMVERARITSGGNLGINSTTPTSRLDVVGDAKFSGIVTATDFNTTSDENLKTNIVTIEDPLDKIVQIRGVNFEWKENGRRSSGVIAQEIEKVLPELVNGGEIKTVNYNGLIGLLIEAIKAQQEEIDILKEKIK